MNLCILSIFQVSQTFASFSKETKALLSEVEKMLHIILVIPASNATAERSFSTLRRLKDWLRSSMLQKRSVFKKSAREKPLSKLSTFCRLNNCAILHTYVEEAESMKLEPIAREFVSKSDFRSSVFGRFLLSPM